MRTLEQWAQEQPDLTSVRFILSAQNYSVHWVNLPGISSRHLAKALPFALEESFDRGFKPIRHRTCGQL